MGSPKRGLSTPLRFGRDDGDYSVTHALVRDTPLRAPSSRPKPSVARRSGGTSFLSDAA